MHENENQQIIETMAEQKTIRNQHVRWEYSVRITYVHKLFGENVPSTDKIVFIVNINIETHEKYNQLRLK